MSTSIYSVTLVDRETGAMQRILVEACCGAGMQEFVEKLPDLQLSRPVVVDVIKTPLTSSGTLRKVG